MLLDQPGYQSSLHQERRHNEDDLPSVLLPCSQFTKADFTLRRQVRLADAPSLQLTPVEYRFVAAADAGGDRRSVLAFENTKHQPCCVLANCPGSHQEPADCAAP